MGGLPKASPFPRVDLGLYSAPAECVLKATVADGSTGFTELNYLWVEKPKKSEYFRASQDLYLAALS